MAFSTWHLCIAIAVIFLAVEILSDEVQESKPDVRPWYETLPAVAMDYKVHIDAGKEDCYYQYVQAGATFYVSFQVILGGDLQVGFVVRDTNNEPLSPYFYNNTEKWEMIADRTDYYAMCIDNTESRLKSKLVNIAAIVVKYDQWNAYTQELAMYNVTAQNLTGSLAKLEKKLKIIQLFQLYFKHQGAMDLALVQVQKSYVQNRSVVTIILVILVSSLQVYFVRKLFTFKSNSSIKNRI